MKTALLLLLLGGFLCELHGAPYQGTPSPLSLAELRAEVHALKAQQKSAVGFFAGFNTEADEGNYGPFNGNTVIKYKKVLTNIGNGYDMATDHRVAFFAGFYLDTEQGYHGPFYIPTTIKYKKVLTNVGGGYSADTGMFTAPLNGTYVFTFVVRTTDNTQTSLRRNDEILAYGYDTSLTGERDATTGVAVVTLEAGDRVYVQLASERRFYGYRGLLNTFSGFLLFPV